MFTKPLSSRQDGVLRPWYRTVPSAERLLVSSLWLGDGISRGDLLPARGAGMGRIEVRRYQ